MHERSPRFQVKLQIVYDDGNAFMSGPVVDISESGVFIETASPLEVGDAVEIAFPRPGGRKLKVQGRVRWVTPFGGLKDARPGMGVELFGVDAEKRELLADLISRRR